MSKENIYYRKLTDKAVAVAAAAVLKEESPKEESSETSMETGGDDDSKTTAADDDVIDDETLAKGACSLNLYITPFTNALSSHSGTSTFVNQSVMYSSFKAPIR